VRGDKRDLARIATSRHPRALQLLMEALRVGDQADAAEALGRLRNPDAVEPLVHMSLWTSDYGVQEKVAQALGRLGNARAVEPLVRMLSGDTAAHREEPDRWGFEKAHWQERAAAERAAAEALGRLGDVRALEPLINALEELRRTRGSARHFRLVRSALKALARLGDARATEAVCYFLEPWDDEGYDLWEFDAAAMALSWLDGTRADRELTERLTREFASEGYRCVAARGLRRLRKVQARLGARTHHVHDLRQEGMPNDRVRLPPQASSQDAAGTAPLAS